ncbi:hypothetical protein [Devosia ginsengisoli]|uniref:hypothetical protein n=1 Tax=Devosia ginsengisoli TaxID=400770 RepID=UPI0026F0369F|nr:hypothetical protein [Devosia ginsengisoli]MCR6671322.1 hypothetical protein [Devosia ginsengisoli]
MTRIRYTLSEYVGDPKDWSYTWELRDDVALQGNCDFCGQTEQRLTYEVARAAERLWICQRCVGRYPVGGMLDDFRLGPRSARAQIHGLTARLKQQTCHDIIREVRAAVADPALEEVLVYYGRNLQLSPQRAAVLFGALPQLPRAIDPRIFEIQSRSTAHQEEFGALTEAQRTSVWPALSPVQKRRLTALGFAPAGAAARKSARSQPATPSRSWPPRAYLP